MAINNRATIPTRLQRYIYNTPEYDAAETYLEGDMVRLGEFLYIAEATTVLPGSTPSATNDDWIQIGAAQELDPLLQTLVDGESYAANTLILDAEDNELYRVATAFTFDEATQTLTTLTDDNTIVLITTELGIENLRNVDGDFDAPSGSTLVFDTDSNRWAPSRVPTATRGSFRLEFNPDVLSGEAPVPAEPYTATFAVNGTSSNRDNAREVVEFRVAEDASLGSNAPFNTGHIFEFSGTSSTTADEVNNFVLEFTFNYANGDTEAFTITNNFTDADTGWDANTWSNTPITTNAEYQTAILAFLQSRALTTGDDGTVMEDELDRILGANNWEFVQDAADDPDTFRFRVIDEDNIPLTGDRLLSNNGNAIRLIMRWRVDLTDQGQPNTFSNVFVVDSQDTVRNIVFANPRRINTAAAVTFSYRATVTVGTQDYLITFNPGTATNDPLAPRGVLTRLRNQLQNMDVPLVFDELSEDTNDMGQFVLVARSEAFEDIVVDFSIELVSTDPNLDVNAFGSTILEDGVFTLAGIQNGGTGTVIRARYTNIEGDPLTAVERNHRISLDRVTAEFDTRDRVRQALEAFFAGTAVDVDTRETIAAPALQFTVADSGDDSLIVTSPITTDGVLAPSFDFQIETDVDGSNADGFGFGATVEDPAVVATGEPTTMTFTFTIQGVARTVPVSLGSFRGAAGLSPTDPGAASDIYNEIRTQITDADVANLTVAPAEGNTDHLVLQSPLGVDLGAALTINTQGAVIRDDPNEDPLNFQTVFDVTFTNVVTSGAAEDVQILGDAYTLSITDEDTTAVAALLKADLDANEANTVSRQSTNTLRIFGNHSYTERLTPFIAESDSGNTRLTYTVTRVGVGFRAPGADTTNFVRTATGFTDAIAGWPVDVQANIAGADQDILENTDGFHLTWSNTTRSWVLEEGTGGPGNAADWAQVGNTDTIPDDKVNQDVQAYPAELINQFTHVAHSIGGTASFSGATITSVGQDVQGQAGYRYFGTDANPDNNFLVLNGPTIITAVDDGVTPDGTENRWITGPLYHEGGATGNLVIGIAQIDADDNVITENPVYPTVGQDIWYDDIRDVVWDEVTLPASVGTVDDMGNVTFNEYPIPAINGENGTPTLADGVTPQEVRGLIGADNNYEVYSGKRVAFQQGIIINGEGQVFDQVGSIKPPVRDVATADVTTDADGDFSFDLGNPNLANDFEVDSHMVIKGNGRPSNLIGIITSNQAGVVTVRPIAYASDENEQVVNEGGITATTIDFGEGWTNSTEYRLAELADVRRIRPEFGPAFNYTWLASTQPTMPGQGRTTGAFVNLNPIDGDGNDLTAFFDHLQPGDRMQITGTVGTNTVTVERVIVDITLPTPGSDLNNYYQIELTGTTVFGADTGAVSFGRMPPTAIYDIDGTPVLAGGITAAEFRTAIGAGSTDPDATKADTDLQNIDDDLTVDEQRTVQNRLDVYSVKRAVLGRERAVLGTDFMHAAVSSDAQTFAITFSTTRHRDIAFATFFQPYEVEIVDADLSNPTDDDFRLVTASEVSGTLAILVTVEAGTAIPAPSATDSGIDLYTATLETIHRITGGTFEDGVLDVGTGGMGDGDISGAVQIWPATFTGDFTVQNNSLWQTTVPTTGAGVWRFNPTDDSDVTITATNFVSYTPGTNHANAAAWDANGVIEVTTLPNIIGDPNANLLSQFISGTPIIVTGDAWRGDWAQQAGTWERLSPVLRAGRRVQFDYNGVEYVGGSFPTGVANHALDFGLDGSHIITGVPQYIADFSVVAGDFLQIEFPEAIMTVIATGLTQESGIPQGIEFDIVAWQRYDGDPEDIPTTDMVANRTKFNKVANPFPVNSMFKMGIFLGTPGPRVTDDTIRQDVTDPATEFTGLRRDAFTSGGVTWYFWPRLVINQTTGLIINTGTENLGLLSDNEEPATPGATTFNLIG